MSYGNDKKAVQLGMPIGTASNRLKKSIIFNFLLRLKENFCYQCGFEIISEEDMSIEHKKPYLDSDNPVELFFNLKNIAFSHLSCNCMASRSRECTIHSQSRYMRGCRCDTCKAAHAVHNAKWRERKAIKGMNR